MAVQKLITLMCPPSTILLPVPCNKLPAAIKPMPWHTIYPVSLRSKCVFQHSRSMLSDTLYAYYRGDVGSGHFQYTPAPLYLGSAGACLAESCSNRLSRPMPFLFYPPTGQK